MANAQKFLDAFAEIEKSLRRMTGADRQRGFYYLVDLAASSNSTVRKFSNDLKEYLPPEQLEPLSRIIAELNERFGLNLGPEHRLTLGQMMERLEDDAALDAAARVNTRENVRLTFDQKVEHVIQDIWKGLEGTPEGDFFVRSGPGTVKLAPDSAKEFIRTRFGAPAAGGAPQAAV